MIIITTTRRPSRRTRSFVRDLYHVIPEAVRRNRGKMSLEDLNDLALELGAERVLVVGTSRGNPSSLTFYEPSPLTIRPISQIHLRGVSLRREITEKRAPSSKKFCVSYHSQELGHLAQILTESFALEEPFLASLEQLEDLYPQCDLSLHLSSEKGGGDDILSTASFYRTHPTFEVGPRMRIRGFRELGEGRSRSED